jgi:AcrR family transcriptional regulator
MDAVPKASRQTLSRKAEQSKETQDRLIKAAKELFTTKGYAGTAMEDLVAKAGMTRGALYHQYQDKRDLFRAVFEAVEVELGQRLALAVGMETDPWQQLRAGARAFLAAATDPAIRRIVLVDGPSVLGWEEWRRIDGQYSLGMVRAVFEMNMAAGNIVEQPVEPLTHLIVGALNEAALAVAAASDADRAREEFAESIERVLDALRAMAVGAPKRAAHQ